MDGVFNMGMGAIFVVLWSSSPRSTGPHPRSPPEHYCYGIINALYSTEPRLSVNVQVYLSKYYKYVASQLYNLMAGSQDKGTKIRRKIAVVCEGSWCQCLLRIQIVAIAIYLGRTPIAIPVLTESDAHQLPCK